MEPTKSLYIEVPFHSSIEAIGASAALVFAFVVFSVFLRERTAHYLWVSCALAGMGIMDAFHSFSLPGNNFVWFHSCSTLVGGVLIALVWLPQRLAVTLSPRFIPLLTLAIALVTGIVSLLFPDIVPLMLVDGSFTSLPQGMNALGGLLYLLASAYFIREYLSKRKNELLFFAILCVLFGVSGEIFFFSSLWSAEWWLWHFVQLTAYLMGIGYFLNGYQKAERVLREKEEKIRLLLNSTAESIYGIDNSGLCTFVNSACLMTLGYQTPSELIGRNMHNLIHHTKADGNLCPADECRIFQAPLEKGEEVHHEDEVFWRKDGTGFPVECWSYPIMKGKQPIGAVVAFVDIAERKDALRSFHAISESMVRYTGLDFFLHAVTMLCEWCDAEVAAIGELRGERVHILAMQLDGEYIEGYSYPLQHTPCDEVAQKGYCVYPEAIAEKFPEDVELLHVRGEGYVGCPVKDRAGNPLGVLWVISRKRLTLPENTRNIFEIIAAKASSELERIRSEEMLLEQHRQLEVMNRELSQAMEELKSNQEQLILAEKMASLGGLVAGLAHEINTPIGIGVTASSFLLDETNAAMKGFAEGELKRSELEAYFRSAKEGSELIQKNLMRTSDLVKSFKLVSGDQSHDEKRALELGSYLEEVLKSLRPQIRRAGLDVSFLVKEPIHVYTFPGAFAQIITNFTMNAIQHAFQEGRQGRVAIALEKNNRNLLLSFLDDGRGIPADVLPKIFDPFFTTKRGEGGTGLGLHIVFNIIHKVFGGKISCESNPKKGTAFNIVIPLKNIEK